MLGFFQHRKRAEVQRVLSGRINHRCFDQIRPGPRRSARSAFSEVLWVIPTNGRGRNDFAAAYPVVGKDISPDGLSLIHTAPMTDERMLVALEGQSQPVFLACTREHCTGIGYGFYQIGLHPDEAVSISDAELSLLKGRLSEFDPRPAAAEAAL